MFRKVSIIGIGHTVPFKKYPDKSLKELAAKAFHEAIEDANISPRDIQAVYVGNVLSGLLLGEETIATQISRSVGIFDVPTVKIEDACSSASAALRYGWLSVASGLYDFVLVGGVERMTGFPTEKVTAAISCAFDPLSERKTGWTFPGFFAALMRVHMKRYGSTREQFAMVAVKNRENASKNPRAQYRDKITVGDVLNSRLICEPLRLFDCCPVSDGAAALILCPADVAKKYNDTPVDILASAQSSGYSTLAEYFDYGVGYDAQLPPTVIAARKAYEMAGITPKDLDFVELHDCFTSAEVIDSEDLGLFKKGEGAKAVEEGLTHVGGKIPINASGGLLSKGHPVGATGAAQIYEVVKQLRGEHENQVPNAEIGLAHNMGGPGAVCTVHILKRRG